MQLLTEKSSLHDFYLEECEMGDMNSAPPTPANARKENTYVTSSEMVEVLVVHDYVKSNPAAAESDTDDKTSQLSDVKVDLGSN